MSLTIGDWVLVIIVFVIGAIVTGWLYLEDFKYGVISSIITISICIASVLLMQWYNTSTASGIRSYKDFKSNMSNGIEREIVITAEDGREIFRYEGKIDIEANHEDNYIKFESEDGRRYMIFYGVQDTIVIIEKEEQT